MLQSVMALSEDYLELKSDNNFIKLQNALEEAEAQIAASRIIYNGHVTELNTKTKIFPANIVSTLHKFDTRDYFELPESEY